MIKYWKKKIPFVLKTVIKHYRETNYPLCGLALVLGDFIFYIGQPARTLVASIPLGALTHRDIIMKRRGIKSWEMNSPESHTIPLTCEGKKKKKLGQTTTHCWWLPKSYLLFSLLELSRRSSFSVSFCVLFAWYKLSEETFVWYLLIPAVHLAPGSSESQRE